jgi:RimJ/RimL family protein N-acetyltransferase
MAMPEVIDAGPVVLRRWREPMAAELADAVRSSLPELRVWMPWADAEPTPAAQAEVLRGGEAQFEEGRAFEYALFEPATTALVGCAGVRHPGPARAEVGYWVRSDRHRRGYARAAAAALTAAALEHLDVEVVELHAHVGNLASTGVARSLGFERVAVRPAGDGQRPGDLGIWVARRGGWTPPAVEPGTG